MIGYTPSHLTENEVILEKLNQIIDYLIKNPSYQVYVYNGGFISGTLTYEIANIINSNNINVADVVVFNNGYYGIISEITETEFTLSQGISLIGPQGPQGPQGPKGDTGTIPESLPQEASALKSGNLPTSGWTATENYLFNGNKYVGKYNWVLLAQNITFPSPLPTSEWKMIFSIDGVDHTINGRYQSDNSTTEYMYVYFRYSLNYEVDCRFYYNGQITAKAGDKGVDVKKLWNSNIGAQAYTISDTSITANSDILMELTDDGEVKSYSMEAGKMTVIRDTVPTQSIPYTYKVKQTNASGQFTVLNHFVPEVPESPTSLPVTYKKASGELPTSGWTPTIQNFSNARILKPTTYYDKEVTIYSSGYAKYIRLTGWEVEIAGEWHKFTKVTDTKYAYNDYSIEYIGSDAIIRYTPSSVQAWYKIYTDGHVSAKLLYNGDTIMPAFRNTEISDHTYTISDTSITANTSVKMYLTDEGGVKAQSKASGSITVIRDTVPTTAIPYEYEVEETSAEGLFEVINAYVPDIPTKTSELTNDSGFITAGEWQNWSDTSVLTEEGLYEIVTTEYPSDGNKTLFVQYEQGKPNNGACWVSVTTANSISVVTPICSGDGTLRVERRLANSSDPADLLTFKYRKIN